MLSIKTSKTLKYITLIGSVIAVFLVFFIGMRFSSRKSTILINEICPRNFNLLRSSIDEYYPRFFIELYNSGDDEVDLEGYRIAGLFTKQSDNIIKDLKIKPDSYALISADEKSKVLKKDLEDEVYFMDTGARTISLYDKDGRLVDAVTFPDMEVNLSYARNNDGEDDFRIKAATPYAPNHIGDEFEASVGEGPLFSAKSGFYEEPFLLEIKGNSPFEKIYYTLDGTEPTSESMSYSGPIEIVDASYKENNASGRTDLSATNYTPPDHLVEKLNIVKACSYNLFGNKSNTSTAIYLVNGLKDMIAEFGGDVPIVSLTADEYDLFDYYNGMLVTGEAYDLFREYLEDVDNGLAKLDKGLIRDPDDDVKDYHVEANFRYRSKKWEKIAEMNYLTKEGIISSQKIGIRTRGKAGSNGPKKSFGFISRDVFGKKGFDKIVSGSGQDTEKMILKSRRTILTDGLITDVMQNRNVPHAVSQPVNLFLNGEYWGLYLMMEKYDNVFFSEFYNVPKDSVTIVKNNVLKSGDPNGSEEFKAILEFCREKDLSKQENYDKLCEMVDVDTVIDYYATLLYIVDQDTADTYNMMVWRCDEYIPRNRFADGKWRYVLYDIDSSLREYDFNYLTDPIAELKPAVSGHTIMKGCLQNQGFREKFYNRVMELLDNEFSPENILPVFEAKKDQIYESMVVDALRYNNFSREEAEAFTDNELNEIREFLTYRKEYLIRHMNDFFTEFS